jgi:molybdate transport system ATP-binding protein
MLDVDIEQQRGAFTLKAAFESNARVTAFFGRSGSGKTSIVDAIAGVSRPDRGHIRVAGTTLFDSARGLWVPPEARRIGYVFQEGLLFPHMNVENNLFYGSRPPSAHAPIASGKVIALLGLEALLKRKPGSLSGGEKQRVAIGRALLSQPQLLLLDEPLASLDGARKGEILNYIEILRDEFRLPVVLVSHAPDEVVRLADTLVLIDEGRVRAVGDVDEIMGRLDLAPATGRYEAGAVVETRVASHDARYELTRLAFAGGELTVPRVAAQIGERVRVRIRARDVSLATEAPRGISINNMLAGTLSEIRDEPGPIVDVRIAVGEAVLIARLTRQSLDRLALKPGLPVYALIKAISLDRHSVGYA